MTQQQTQSDAELAMLVNFALGKHSLSALFQLNNL